MAGEGMLAHDLARPGFLEPLGRTFMGLQLRHNGNSLELLTGESIAIIALQTARLPLAPAPFSGVVLPDLPVPKSGISLHAGIRR